MAKKDRRYRFLRAQLAPLRGPQLLVADLAMMYLDLAAAERGFATPP